MSQEWAAQELAGINLGDVRLNKRSVTLLDRLADKPTASIPHACNGWAETQAAYRFLAQEEIGWEDILSPHFSCTQQRMQGRPVVLCIQDTTELDFNGQQTEGLGTLSFPAQRGMYLHPTYAVSPEREPLGVLDAWMWVRDASKTASRSLPAGLIPIPSHDIPWTGSRFAQLRVHSERIALGIWVNLFHASQQASMMSS